MADRSREKPAPEQILQKDNPLLRTKSKEILYKEITSNAIEGLCERLTATLAVQRTGVAISAVQIGEPVRLFLIDIPARGDTERLGPMFFANPAVIHTSVRTVKMYEACLSIDNADLYGEVERPAKVRIRFYNERGDQFEEEFDGFLSRVIQHELDHLEGRLFTDIVDENTLKTEAEYLEWRKRQRQS